MNAARDLIAGVLAHDNVVPFPGRREERVASLATSIGALDREIERGQRIAEFLTLAQHEHPDVQEWLGNGRPVLVMLLDARDQLDAMRAMREAQCADLGAAVTGRRT